MASETLGSAQRAPWQVLFNGQPLERGAAAGFFRKRVQRFAALVLVVLLASGATSAGAEALPAPEGIVVDSQGRPVEDAAVFLSAWPGQDPDGSVATLGRALTDAQGHFRMEPPPPAAFRGHIEGTLWAYKPGLAVGAARYGAYGATPVQRPVRISLDPPGTRSITLRRSDGSPSPGVKVAPISATMPDRRVRGGAFPDELAELVSVVSDEQGQVVLASLPRGPQSNNLHVWSGPSIQRILAPAGVARDAERLELIIEPAGALEGVVKRSDGKPPEGLTVRIHADRGGPVRLEGGPIRVGPEGTFRTPPILLAGQRYRAIVQGEGYRPVVSSTIEPAGDRQTVSLGDLVVEPLRVVSGRVVDRQGQPIEGAEVIQAGDGPVRTSARTDAAGRFALGGYQEGPALISARAEGFRFGGRVVASGENSIVLTRVTETPERPMPRLRPDLPAAELRTLSRRVLDPYLRAILKTNGEGGKYRALTVMSILDPAEALATLEEARLSPSAADRMRMKIAVELARTDPDAATAVAQSIAEPADRLEALLSVTEALPGNRRALRIALLEQAAVGVRSLTNPDRRLRLLGDIGERLVEEGAIEQARPLFAEGLALARANHHPTEWRFIAARLARVDLPEALKLIDEIPTPDGRSDALANTAIHIAGSQPAECEQLFARLPEEDRAASRITSLICDRMAGIDPVRARRIVTGIAQPRERGFLGIILARGLARGSKRDAEQAFRAALADLDASPPDDSFDQTLYSLRLPLIEEIDPGLVPEYLWRCLSLRKPDDGLGSRSLRIRTDARVVAVVAQYDRELAEPLWTSIASRLPALEPLERDRAAYDTEVTVARAHLDPRTAVAWVESRPEPEKLDEYGQYEPRFVLSNLLALWSVGRRDTLLPYTIGPYEALTRRDPR